MPTTGREFKNFRGDHSGGRKIADLAVKFRDLGGDLEYRFVLEVGFSEKYERLVGDAHLWLEENNTVRVCITIHLPELPIYKAPDAMLDGEQFLQPKVSEFILPDKSLGPASYQGYNWTGETQETNLEVWTRNVMTGKAMTDGVRYVCILYYLRFFF